MGARGRQNTNNALRLLRSRGEHGKESLPADALERLRLKLGRPEARRRKAKADREAKAAKHAALMAR